MLPTIVGLNSIKLAQMSANDTGRALVARNEKGRFVPLAQATANDKIDAYQKTLDRIMARHNGHDRPIPRAANVPDAYETTMDRIMQRHNGHDRPLGDPANDLKYRIFHEPNGPLPQAGPRPDPRNWEPYEEKPLLLNKRYVAPDDDNNENENSVSPKKRKRASEYLLLKKIEKNTDKCTKLLEEIRDIEKERDDGMGVDSLRAKEMAKEDWQGNYPSSSKSSSSMAREGKEDGGESKLQAIMDLKGKALEAAAFLGLGWVTKKVGEAMGTTPDNPGGGHTSEKQRPGNRAVNNNLPNNQPAPAPRPDVLSPGYGAPQAPTDIQSDKLTDREKAFVKMIMTSEGAPSVNTTFGMNAKGQSKYITPEQMYGGRHLSELSVNEVIAYQDKLTADTRKKGWKGRADKSLGTSAVGLGQFIKPTMISTLKDMGYKEKDFETLKLDQELQSRMIVHILANKRKLALKDIDKWSDKDLAALGKEWESLDVSKGKISKEELRRRLAEVGRYDPNRISGKSLQSPPPKEADHTEWRMDDKKKTQKAMQQFSKTRGKAQKLSNGATVTNHGSRSTVVLGAPRKADAATEALAARIAADKKKGVPPAKSESWGDWAKRYFNWD